MDKIIEKYTAVPNHDLIISKDVAYQADMSNPVPYDKAYFDKYVNYEDTQISRELNTGRYTITNKYILSKHFKYNICDIGIGSGEFIKQWYPKHIYGYDINPEGVKWLKERGIYEDYFKIYRILTFWDSLEHMENPGEILEQVQEGSYIIVSIPIFEDLAKVRESKHYRPNEHFYYFTEKGLINWLKEYGFELVEKSDFEIKSGREDIYTFVFRKTILESEE